MTKAAFLTSSCDRPSVTTTSTLGTFFLMPLSQVKTFSLINVRALPIVLQGTFYCHLSEKYPNANRYAQLRRIWISECGSTLSSTTPNALESEGLRSQLINCTCSCVSSSVPNILEGPKGLGLVIVRVQLELRLDLVTVLHKWDLKGNVVGGVVKTPLSIVQLSSGSSCCWMGKINILDLTDYYKLFTANTITLTTIVSLNLLISNLQWNHQ